MSIMEDYIMNAIEHGTSILKDDDYTSDYRTKVNEVMQLLLKAQDLIKID